MKLLFITKVCRSAVVCRVALSRITRLCVFPCDNRAHSMETSHINVKLFGVYVCVVEHILCISCQNASVSCRLNSKASAHTSLRLALMHIHADNFVAVIVIIIIIKNGIISGQRQFNRTGVKSQRPDPCRRYGWSVSAQNNNNNNNQRLGVASAQNDKLWLDLVDQMCDFQKLQYPCQRTNMQFYEWNWIQVAALCWTMTMQMGNIKIMKKKKKGNVYNCRQRVYRFNMIQTHTHRHRDTALSFDWRTSGSRICVCSARDARYSYTSKRVQ